LLLRLQIAALQRLWELPPEFEAICKDVWALHLTMLDTQIDADSVSELEGNAPTGGY
jgi:RNA polymerase I-specific transcription initiation factor RRN7